MIFKNNGFVKVVAKNEWNGEILKLDSYSLSNHDIILSYVSINKATEKYRVSLSNFDDIVPFEE